MGESWKVGKVPTHRRKAWLAKLQRQSNKLDLHAYLIIYSRFIESLLTVTWAVLGAENTAPNRVVREPASQSKTCIYI